MAAMFAPSARRPGRRPVAAVAALVVAPVVLLVLGACGDDGEADGGSGEEATERTTTTLPPVPADFDWWTFNEAPLGGDWVLEPCEGADASLCFVRLEDGEPVEGAGGFVGIFRFDVSPDFDLNAHAARFVEDFRGDRRSGCGAEYRVEAEAIEPLELPDGPARRYGFVGGAQNSADTERTVQWAGVRGTSLVIVTLSAYDPGSCVAAVGEATFEELETVLPAIERLIRTEGLPDPAGIPAPSG
jgi:hypothetical protein